MADDRTPRTISLTECPPDENVPARKREKDAAERRQVRLDHEAVVASERKISEQRTEERPGSRLT